MLKHKFIATFATILLLLSPVSNAQKAPVFSLPGDGVTHDLTKLKGKVVYIDFWASWCVPCRKSFPWMNDMRNRYDRKDLQIIAINLDSDRDEARKFLDKIPANFDIAYDPDGEVAAKYDLQVMPSSYLINKNGEVVFAHKGFREGDTAEIEAKIQKLIR
jgi:thiol-disulfide isomerase/thioredoxin